jgi:hypothetical protein
VTGDIAVPFNRAMPANLKRWASGIIDARAYIAFG